MVAAFSVLRMIAVLRHPVSFPDTKSYMQLSFVGDSERLWTVPLVWKVFPSDGLREAVQLAFGVLAWSTLAVTVSSLVSNVRARRVAVVAALALGLVTQVTSWDSTLLSESLSTSLLVLLIALMLRVHQRSSRSLIVVCVAVTVLWVFARQVNVVVYVLLLPFVVVFLLRRIPRWRTAPLIALIAVFAAVAAWGLFAITRPGIGSGVWKQNALQILEDRIAPDPAALSFLYSRGLPRSPEILTERGAFPGSTSPLFRDPTIIHWLDHDFKPSYFAYLLTHPRYSVLNPFAKMAVAASEPVDTLAARAVLPGPVADSLWGTNEGDIPFWVAVAAILAVMAFASRAAVRVVPVTVFFLLASAVASIVVWDTTGDPPASSSLARQAMPVSVALRIGLLLTIVTCADALLRERRRDANRGV